MEKSLIKSNSIYWAFVFAVTIVLLWDFRVIYTIYIGEVYISTAMYVISSIGIMLKFVILSLILLKAGPVKILLVIWGAFFLAGGVLGLLALGLNAMIGDEIPASAYRIKGSYVIVGILIIYFANIGFGRAENTP